MNVHKPEQSMRQSFDAPLVAALAHREARSSSLKRVKILPRLEVYTDEYFLKSSKGLNYYQYVVESSEVDGVGLTKIRSLALKEY
jgi:hypothetical protein